MIFLKSEDNFFKLKTQENLFYSKENTGFFATNARILNIFFGFINVEI